MQTENPMSIVALNVSLSNDRDQSEWIGADEHTVYNFSPSSRPTPFEIHAISSVPLDKPVIGFVPSRKQCRSSALDILAHCVADDNEETFWNASLGVISSHLNIIRERPLAESIARDWVLPRGAEQEWQAYRRAPV